VYVRPTTKRGSLKPGYTVSARLNGGPCLPSVDVVGGTYACVGGEGDGSCWPLGQATKAREVFCLKMPWEHSGTEIALRQRLRPLLPVKPSQSMIWAVELTSGQRCSPLHGALSLFGGVPIDFSCIPPDLDLLGKPDKTQARWTIQEAVAHFHKAASVSDSAGPLGRIAVAWYGLGAAT